MQASAAPLTSKALYYKCYSQLTGVPPQNSSKFNQDPKHQSLDPISECRRLLNRTVLNKKTGILEEPQNLEANMILNQIHELHSSWFTNKSLHPTSDNFSDLVTKDFYDPTEPALYFTRSLFEAGIPVSTSVTSNIQLRALRAVGPSKLGPFSKSKCDGPSLTNVDYESNNKCDLPLVELGPLIGVRTQSDVQITTKQNMSDKMSPNTTESATLFRHFGGGILGAQAHLMAVPMQYDFKSDGGRVTARVWANSVFNDLLCLPPASLSKKEVEKYRDLHSSLSFRNESSCLQCHASLDQLAGVVRGIHYVQSPLDRKIQQAHSKEVLPYSIDFYQPSLGASEIWNSEPDKDDAYRNPRGKLLFKSHIGTITDIEINSLAGLGQEIANSTDFYLCIVSRYYEYFTGNRVDLFDTSNSNIGFKTVEKIASNLRSHQNLKKTLIEIMSLPEYKSKISETKNAR